jgi:arylsulfatase A-like enzyme
MSGCSTARFALVALATAAICLPLAAAPNILLISVDTLRADRLSSYGYERNTTPRIDELLARGVRFTHARTIEPLTAPALASMLTSLPPHEHGGSRNGLRIRQKLVSFSKILGRRGYSTAAFVGNWTLQDRLTGLGEHFETYNSVLNRKRWLGMVKSEATAEDLNERALEWFEQHLDSSRPKPFLLWVHYVEPHGPYELHSSMLEQLGVDFAAETDAADRYDTEVAWVDARIGELLDAVFERVSWEETLVVFVADHGESLGDHGYWGHGRHVYEASLRIPMGLVWEGRIAPGVRSEPALITDLAPTLLSAAELEIPEFFQGFDWLPALSGTGAAPADRVTLFQAHKGTVLGTEDASRARQRGLLEVARIESEKKEVLRVGKDRRRVFDLNEDPAENRGGRKDGELSPELARWLEQVRRGLELADDLPPPSLSDEDLEAMRALGYID